MVDTVLLVRRPPFVAGRWYDPIASIANAGSALVQNSIRLMPFWLDEPITVSALGTRVTTLSAGGNIDLAIYAGDSVSGLPTGAALASSGSLTTASAADVSANLGANVLLPRGLYWCAVNADNSVACCVTRHGQAPGASFYLGSATLSEVTPAGSTLNLILTFAHTFGTWPNLTGQTLVRASSSATAPGQRPRRQPWRRSGQHPHHCGCHPDQGQHR